MENLVKTTNLRFRTSKDGFSAEVTATKDVEGNITRLNINSVQKGDTFIGDLSLTGNAVAEIEGVAALVAQALSEANAEGESEVEQTSSEEE